RDEPILRAGPLATDPQPPVPSPPIPMRLLLVSLRGPTNAARRGGAQDYIRAIAAPWVRDGHAVTILCAQEALPEGGTPPEAETVDGIEVVRVGTPQTRVGPLVAEAKARASGVDSVIENIMAFPMALPWRLPRNTPLVAVKHHFQGATFVRSQGRVRGTVGRLLEDGLQPLAYRDTPLVVPSRMTAEHVRNLRLGHRGPLHIIPPPVPLPSPEAAAGDHRAAGPTILYLGALHLSRKRVDHLLSAFETVRQRLPSARLVIAGDGPDRAALEAQASGAGDAVRFAGFVSDAEKAHLLREAWVFASPSLQEGFGITWVEAGAYSLPVVGYRIDGLDTVDETCALMVDPGDVDALASGLASVLADDALRQRLSAGARANAARFDPEAASRAFLGVIEQAVKDARA
ncbi:MAG: glycosyltransferase family 4 protein, partial [Bacteroidota bacterium]